MLDEALPSNKRRHSKPNQTADYPTVVVQVLKLHRVLRVRGSSCVFCVELVMIWDTRASPTMSLHFHSNTLASFRHLFETAVNQDTPATGVSVFPLVCEA